MFAFRSSVSPIERLREVLALGFHDLLLELRLGDELLELPLVGGAVQRQLDDLARERGVERGVVQFDRVTWAERRIARLPRNRRFSTVLSCKHTASRRLFPRMA